MKIFEYANIKLEGYKSLGWNISNLVSDDAKISFNSKDLNGIYRSHLYSDAAIEVKETAEVAPKKTKKPKKGK